MKAPFSPYLNSLAPGLKELIRDLKKDYSYVSVLAADSKGMDVVVSRAKKEIDNRNMTTERGVVVRIYANGQYSEYALNDFDPMHPEATAETIRSELAMQEEILKMTDTRIYMTPPLEDEPCELFVEKETEQLPEDTDIQHIIDKFTEISEAGIAGCKDAVDVQVSMQSTHINKMFLTENRDMRQSYVYSEGAVTVIVTRNGRTEGGYHGISDACGPELADRLMDSLDPAAAMAEETVSSEAVIPGEYEIITSPEVTGLIAHEAFGHGVEMDQFVKNRALGAEYIGKRVGSDLVTMHEGALCAENVTSYAFDDEGIPASDVTEIDHGILKTGICDALSAVRLHVKPTGNGKRENYAHKVYTRMTNTIFDSGTDHVEDMIRSVKYGYLLEGMQSGMEDPKHWGIQCIIAVGKEIKDGVLTGKTVAPVIMTGYVPDLLNHISMVSVDREIFGNGGCGKGHKEWVKVSDGGPYLKTKARLG